MTRQDAIKEFKKYVLPKVIRSYGKKDEPAILEAWGIFLDSLQRDGFITMKQYESWIY